MKPACALPPLTKWLSKIYEDSHGKEARRKFNYIQLLVIFISEDVTIFSHLKSLSKKIKLISEPFG